MIDYRNRKFILIYQMGKVGSTSIKNTLKRKGYIIWSLHTLSGNLLKKIYRNYKNLKCLNSFEKIRLVENNVKKLLNSVL